MFRELFFVIFIILSLCSARCPLPRCHDCLPRKVHEAPGVGFDLAVSYGTAAVNEYDGTVTNVAKVSASSAYLEVIARLANSSSNQNNFYHKTARSIRKSLGYAATHDIGILAGMIDQLQKATLSKFPSLVLDRVVVTAPLLPALTSEDLNEALDFVGLQSWLVYRVPYPRRLSESKAIFAANGDGLCTNYQHLYWCKGEEQKFPLHTVYSVTYTYHALYISLDTFRAPFGITSRKEVFLLDFHAGLGGIAKFATPDEYWQHVHAQLQRMGSQSGTPITKLQLAGDNVTDPTFLKTLKDALHGNLGQVPETENNERIQMLSMLLADPIFLAARGAALYARRRQEVPYNRVEAKGCEEQRKKEGEQSGFAKQELR